MYEGNQIRGLAGLGDARYSASGSVGGSVIGAVEQQRAAEIPHELERLERTLKGIGQGVETLTGKLESSVMRSEPPSDCKNASTPSAVPQTPYGSRLQELVSFAAILNERIQAINARLEV